MSPITSSISICGRSRSNRLVNVRTGGGGGQEEEAEAEEEEAEGEENEKVGAVVIWRRRRKKRRRWRAAAKLAAPAGMRETTPPFALKKEKRRGICRVYGNEVDAVVDGGDDDDGVTDFAGVALATAFAVDGSVAAVAEGIEISAGGFQPTDFRKTSVSTPVWAKTPIGAALSRRRRRFYDCERRRWRRRQGRRR